MAFTNEQLERYSTSYHLKRSRREGTEKAY